MSRGTNQKFKFTYLMKIMLAKTDDEMVDIFFHGKNMKWVLFVVTGKYGVFQYIKHGNFDAAYWECI